MVAQVSARVAVIFDPTVASRNNQNESAMPIGTRIKLSAMMFLQFMLFAVWFVQLSAYATGMGVKGSMLSLIVSSMAIGCLVSPIVGMIADRHFSSQKVLAVLNGFCAVLLFGAARVTDPTMLFIILLGAMLCYMPTWGLTSAIAMSNSPAEKFPQIRVFGSMGWVACAKVSSSREPLVKSMESGRPHAIRAMSPCWSTGSRVTRAPAFWSVLAGWSTE